MSIRNSKKNLLCEKKKKNNSNMKETKIWHGFEQLSKDIKVEGKHM